MVSVDKAALIAALLLPTMASAAIVSGRVVNIQNQQVLRGATVSVGGQLEVTADEAGFFRIDQLAAGPQLLRVRTADGAEFSARVVVPRRQSMYVELDQARHTAPEDEDEY